MKKQIAILGCFLLLLNACGKSEETTTQSEEDLIGFEIEERFVAGCSQRQQRFQRRIQKI